MKTTCLYCEKEYDTKRDSSIFCSNSCRTGHYKLRKKNALVEAERQIAAKVQKEKDEKLKLIDDELRKQKAAKRKKAKEDKALKASQENEKITHESSHIEANISEPGLPPENNQKQPEESEKTADLPLIPRVLTVKQQLELIKKSNSGRTKQPTLLDFLTEITKYYNNKNK